MTSETNMWNEHLQPANCMRSKLIFSLGFDVAMLNVLMKYVLLARCISSIIHKTLLYS